MKIQTLIAALALTVGASAFAQVPIAPVAPVAPITSITPKDPTATAKIDQRQANQQKRIDQGVASGALTPKETAKLEKRETKIAADKAVAKSDGTVTKTERRKLKREENRASKAIYKQKHDAQKVTPVAAK